jgi:hypothetical protein
MVEEDEEGPEGESVRFFLVFWSSFWVERRAPSEGAFIRSYGEFPLLIYGAALDQNTLCFAAPLEADKRRLTPQRKWRMLSAGLHEGLSL